MWESRILNCGGSLSCRRRVGEAVREWVMTKIKAQKVNEQTNHDLDPQWMMRCKRVRYLRIVGQAGGVGTLDVPPRAAVGARHFGQLNNSQIFQPEESKWLSN